MSFVFHAVIYLMDTLFAKIIPFAGA